MNEEKKNRQKGKRVLKRLMQVLLLALLAVILGVVAYVAVAATRLMKIREQQAANRAYEASIAQSKQAAQAAAEASTEPQETETTAEPTTESEEETSAFSFIDLFNPDLFREPDEDTEDLAALAEKYAAEKHIWMGDSRMVGMSRVAAGPNDVYIAKGAMAYDWFSTEGLTQLMAELQADPKRIVVINFGVNDCANNCAGWREYFVEDYVETINQLTALYPETRFYFASVGLIDGDYKGKNQMLPRDQVNLLIDQFNETMYSDCLAEYIDLSEYLIREGVVTADHVHYDSATYQKIYTYLVAKAGKYEK